MRIDKYLKNARIIKRRAIAKEACDQGKVNVNGKAVKAGHEVKIGDVIEIDFGTRTFKGQILDIKDHVTKEGAKDLYQLLDQ